MLLEPDDIESLAIDTYRRARLDPTEPVAAATLARLAFGARIVRPSLWAGGCVASTGWLHGKPLIGISRRASPELAQHHCGHEVAHLVLAHALGSAGVAALSQAGALELACDHLGAALIAPRPTVRVLHGQMGFDLTALAAALVVTQTCAALRLGEALALPLVSWGAKLRVRGPANWQWPDIAELERWRHRPPRGIELVRVSDQPGRVVLVAA